MNFWNNKTVLVTGIDGFVGSHLAKELVKRRANVVGIVRHRKPRHRSYLALFNLLDKIRVVTGDVRDYHLLTEVLSTCEVEHVFHLAAQAIVKTSTTSPFDTLDSNIRGTYTLLDACRNLKTLKAIVVASSDKAYGTLDTLPYLETSPLNARNVYECSKACTDQLALSYAWNFDLPVTVTRCCNIVGFDLNFSRLIPRTIVNLMAGEAPVIYSGVADFTREFMHSDDTVDAYLSVAEQIDKTKGKPYNVASGNVISIKEAVKKIGSLMKSNLGYKIIEKDVSHFKEIPNQYLSGHQIAAEIGWRPRIGMDEMLSRSIESYASFRSIVLPGAER